MQQYIVRLREDPALVARLEQLKQQAIAHPALQDYIQDLWARIHGALRRDLEQADSAIARHLEQSLQGLGQAWRATRRYAKRSTPTCSMPPTA